MSDKISVLDCKTSVFIAPKESLIQSIFKDLTTLAILAFCIYISKDSTWWTFITGGMFLFYLYGIVSKLIKENTATFRNADDAIEYLKGLGK